MIDHAEFIRRNWCNRHDPFVRDCLKRAVAIRRLALRHGNHKLWAHKPIGGDR